MRTLPRWRRPQHLFRTAEPQQAQRDARPAVARGARRCSTRSSSRADVLVESFRPSTARRLGVDAATAARPASAADLRLDQRLRPERPVRGAAAHDHQLSGARRPARPPALPGPLIGDIGAAHAGGAADSRRADRADSHRRRRGDRRLDSRGRAGLVDVSRRPPTSRSACYNIYETADGEWLALGALEREFWAGFCERIGRPI